MIPELRPALIVYHGTRVRIYHDMNHHDLNLNIHHMHTMSSMHYVLESMYVRVRETGICPEASQH